MTLTTQPRDHRSPPLSMDTERLQLRASHSDAAMAVIDYHRRNDAHLSRWDPPRPEGHWSLAATASRLQQELLAFQTGSMWRYWLTLPSDPERIIGQCQLSQVQRGCFQNAMLGYGLDASMTGRGLMTEALAAVISEVFREPVRLHRLQAAVRPENLPSRRVLERLGFTLEGRCASYLFIDGAWRDHEIFALVNSTWPVDVPMDG